MRILLLFPLVLVIDLLYAQGKVGININTPLARLHVYHAASTGTPNASAIAVFESNAAAYLNLLTRDDVPNGILFGKAAGSDHGGIIYNHANTLNGLQFRTNGNLTRMVISNTGDVGIGTTSPAKKLHVFNASSTGTPHASAIAVFESNVNSYLNLLTRDEVANGILFGKASGADHGGIIYNDALTLNGLQFRTNGNLTRMVISSAGNIGMGTVSPAKKLHVFNASSTGTPHASAIAVFESNVTSYLNLLTRDDVANGILFGKAAGADHGGIIYNDPVTLNGMQFRVNGNSTKMVITSAGNIGIGTTTPGSLLEVNGTAAKPGGGDWVASSDRRLKQHVEPYTDGLTEVLAIEPVFYQYNALSGYSTEETYIGVIAQEVQEVAPYMVSETSRVMVDGSSGYLEVDSSPMTFMLINAVKEQQKIIESLRLRIEKLENKIQDDMLSMLSDQ